MRYEIKIYMKLYQKTPGTKTKARTEMLENILSLNLREGLF